MPGGRAEDVLAAGDHDPRYVYNMVMRQVAVENMRKEAEESPIGIFGPLPPRRIPRRIPRHKIKIDWAVSLENGYVPRNQFPAKYQFDVTGENCNSDYIVFGLTVTGTQANLVGINNLYTSASPTCTADHRGWHSPTTR